MTRNSLPVPVPDFQCLRLQNLGVIVSCFRNCENTRNVALRGRSESHCFALSAAARHSVLVPMTISFSRPGSSYFPLDHIFVCSQLRKHDNSRVRG